MQNRRIEENGTKLLFAKSLLSTEQMHDSANGFDLRKYIYFFTIVI